MRVLYFSSHFESNYFISRQVAEISDQLDVYYMCITADHVQLKSNTKLRFVKYPQNKWVSRIKNKLELSDLYINYRNESFAWEVSNLVKEIKPDIIHCQYGSDAIKLWDNYFDPSQKYVVTFRGFDASLFLILKKYVNKLKYYLSQPNVHSLFVCHHLRQNLIANDVKLNTVSGIMYSNTDTGFYTRQNYNLPRNKIVFTQVSNFREKKGHIYTIKAFDLFHKRNPTLQFEVNFVGDKDGDYEELLNLIRGLSVFPMLNFLGKKNEREIKDILEHSHVFVHHSITSRFNDEEGIPNSVMEAMSMELPILATRHSGIPELVTEQTDVLLSDEKNIEEYAQNMERSVAIGYSKGNRLSVINKFSRQTFKQNILAFYNRVLSEKKIEFTQCTQCVLGLVDDPEISFNQEGVCSYCRNYEVEEIKFVKKGKAGEVELSKIVTQIKASGKGMPYDCILGRL